MDIVAKVTSLFRAFDVPEMLALVKKRSLAVDSLARDLQDDAVFETCVTTRKIQEVTSSTHSGVERLQVEIMRLQDLVSGKKMIRRLEHEHLRKSTNNQKHSKQ